MPTIMESLVVCAQCGENRKRKDMTPFNSLCAICFEQCYAVCYDCGCLIRRGGTRIHPEFREIYGRYISDMFNPPQDYYSRLGPQRDGLPRCYGCWDARYSNSSDRWRPTPLSASFTTYERIRSKRKYGVEIETHVCPNYEALQNNTNFGCKPDCSIMGLEFDSPVLYGDEGLTQIEEFLSFGDRHGWSVSDDCGCHTHYDMRDESDVELYRVAYAYAISYFFWKRCVSDKRRNNSYCRAPRYSGSDIRRYFVSNQSFTRNCYNGSRYDYVNLEAYYAHRTFEIRLLEGTLDANIICNWIRIHTSFIDYVKTKTFDELDELFGRSVTVDEALANIISIVDDVELGAWLVSRLKEFDDQR